MQVVLLFALGVSVLAGAFFGLAPALQAARVDASQVLRQESRAARKDREARRGRSALWWSPSLRSLGTRSHRLTAMTLLIAAGLLSRSFWDLNVRLGFDPENAAPRANPRQRRPACRFCGRYTWQCLRVTEQGAWYESNWSNAAAEIAWSPSHGLRTLAQTAAPSGPPGTASSMSSWNRHLPG